MLVICLEGCHGSGKTELCDSFRERGYEVLDEGFLDMPDFVLHPQSLLMETTWVCSWFTRLLKMRSALGDSHVDSVFIADRSPFSAVFYSKKGHLLKPTIVEMMAEVREAGDIEIRTIVLIVDCELLWKRIMRRLEEQPHRFKYNEHLRHWMETVSDFYDGFEWDLCVENNDMRKAELALLTVQSLVDKWPHMSRHFPPSKFRTAPLTGMPLLEAETLDCAAGKSCTPTRAAWPDASGLDVSDAGVAEISTSVSHSTESRRSRTSSFHEDGSRSCGSTLESPAVIPSPGSSAGPSTSLARGLRHVASDSVTLRSHAREITSFKLDSPRPPLAAINRRSVQAVSSSGSSRKKSVNVRDLDSSLAHPPRLRRLSDLEKENIGLGAAFSCGTPTTNSTVTKSSRRSSLDDDFQEEMRLAFANSLSF